MGETIGAEVPAQLKERIDEHREPDESRSAAIERLVRDGLDNENQNSTPIYFLLLLGSLSFGAALEPAASSELLIAMSGAAFLLAAAVERGVL